MKTTWPTYLEQIAPASKRPQHWPIILCCTSTFFFPNFKFRQVSQHLNKQKLAENLNGKKKKIRPQLLVQSVSRVGFEGENLNNFCLAFSRRFKRVHRARHKIVKHSIVVVERLWRCAMTFNESSRDTSSSDGVWLATDLKRQGFRTANGAAAKAGS